jgi:hypothetical protein
VIAAVVRTTSDWRCEAIEPAGASNDTLPTAVPHIGQRQATRRQLPHVDVDAEHLGPVAEDLQVGHAVGRQQPVLHQILHQPRQFLGLRRAEVIDSRITASALASALTIRGACMPSGRLLDDPGDGIAHVGGGNIQIGGVGKLHRHAAAAKAVTTDEDDIACTPETRLAAPSMIAVISRSMVSGAAAA